MTLDEYKSRKNKIVELQRNLTDEIIKLEDEEEALLRSVPTNPGENGYLVFTNEKIYRVRAFIRLCSSDKVSSSFCTVYREDEVVLPKYEGDITSFRIDIALGAIKLP